MLTLPLIVLACCAPPAKFFGAECEPRCINESSVRVGTNDGLVAGPDLWKFYDEYGEGLPSACGNDGGVRANGLTPLWRRTIVPAFPGYSESRYSRHLRGRSALAIHPDARLAVSLGGVVWLLDAVTGIPSHILYSADVRHLPLEQEPNFEAPVVAFTPDGKKLWTDSRGPLLLDLQTFDRREGFRVEYSWYAEHAQTFLEAWDSPSQTVGADGTLFWTTQYGKTRALEPSGHVRWESEAASGFAMLDGNDNTFWNESATGLRPEDGGVMWTPTQLQSWRGMGLLTNVEGTRIRNLIPVQHSPSATPGDELALHRLDGTIAGILPDRVALGTATAQADELLFVSAADSKELASWNTNTLQRKWATLLSGYVDVGPIIPEGSRNAWVVTSDCRVSELDEQGVVKRWHQMDGAPMDQIARVSNGVLYVLSMTRNQLAAGEEVIPGQLLRVDGGTTSPADYGCYSNIGSWCGLPIRPGPIFFLYAYQIG